MRINEDELYAWKIKAKQKIIWIWIMEYKFFNFNHDFLLLIEPPWYKYCEVSFEFAFFFSKFSDRRLKISSQNLSALKLEAWNSSGCFNSGGSSHLPSIKSRSYLSQSSLILLIEELYDWKLDWLDSLGVSWKKSGLSVRGVGLN